VWRMIEPLGGEVRRKVEGGICYEEVISVSFNFGDGPYNPCADFDRDGSINFRDLFVLNQYWGSSPDANCTCTSWPPDVNCDE